MTPAPRLAAAVLASAALAACSVPPVGEVEDEATEEDVPGAADAVEASEPDFLPCKPATAAEDCPDGWFCESGARVCVECLFDVERCAGPEAREVCPRPEALEPGVVEGGFFEVLPCAEGEVCVEGAGEAACAPVVCGPGEVECAGPTLERVCDPSGTAEYELPCQKGHACYEDGCKPVRHNVLLVFDTSNSMNTYAEPPPGTKHRTPASCGGTDFPCYEPFPACEDPAAPLTLIGLAKATFHAVVEETLGGFAQFALQRFPQKEATGNVGTCHQGWYASVETMTGDEDEKETEDGGWFDEHRTEVLVVPFPTRATLENHTQILRWLDFDESLAPTANPCSDESSCGPGRCQAPPEGGAKVCWKHAEPELRGGGQTPLGKSLFYAGEYLRRQVLIDGKPCEGSSDCPSVGYSCQGGECRDPYAKCRDTFVLLFTDGDESLHPTPGDFFHPAIQAKRLAFGLGCAGDDDCRGGATCKSKVCVPPGGTLAALKLDGLVYDDPDDFDALSRPDGSPVSVRTTVINLHAEASGSLQKNEAIARAGGGASLDVYAGDPDLLKATLFSEMSPNYKCEPDELAAP